MILNVKDLDEFKQQLAAAGDKLVVVDFTASWCGPCKQISPVFEEQHKLPDNSNVVFLTVDVDEADDVASNCGVSCMPTFIFYKNGTKVFEFSGAHKDLLREKIKELK